MDYYIITGVSRGIGEAIARRLLAHGNKLIVASRTMNEDLVEIASSGSYPLFYFEYDLSEKQHCSDFIHQAFDLIDPASVSRIALINNAGMLEPVGTLETIRPEDMQKNMDLNFQAPAILSSVFIENTLSWKIPKSIVNISSGASSYPYAGWSIYCSSKAALDMLTRTVALEQEQAVNPVKIYALAPGIVDTAMQTRIRNSDPDSFPERGFFVRLHQEGKLLQTDVVASVVSRSMFNGKIPQGGLLNLDQLNEFAE